MLAAEDKEGETGDEGGKDCPLHPGGVFEVAQHLVRAAAAPGLARGEPAFHQSSSAQEVKHGRYFRDAAAGVGRRAVLLIGVDDGADKFVPNDILVTEINKSDPGHTLERLERFEQARAFVRRKIDLSAVAGHDALRARPDPGQEHEHLLAGGVLRFIEDDEGVAQRAPAHVGERRDLDRLARDVALQLLGLEHVVQRVVERPQVGRDLLLQVTGQKTKRFARFDRRPRQDDAIDLLLFQRRHRHGHGQVGFTRPGRADPEDDIVFLDRLEIISLPRGARDNRRLARRSLDFGRSQLTQTIGTGFVHRIECVIEFVPLDVDPSLPGGFQLGEDALRFRYLRGLAFELDPAFAGGDFHPERFLEVLDQFQIVRVERLHGPRVFKL